MLDLQLSPFLNLTTERLYLRQLRKEDAPELFGMRSDPRAVQFLERDPEVSIDQTLALLDVIEKLFRDNEGMAWAITLKGGDDKLIGLINFWNITKENHRAEIGYMLLPEYWNKGIMNEALEAAIDAGFRHFHFHSLEANVNPENTASVRILEKQGFVREGYFRENCYFKGKFYDSAVYSKLQPED